MSAERPRVDLSRFNNADFPKGAGVVKMTLWYFTNALFFINPCFPFRAVNPGLLRLFGARVGKGEAPPRAPPVGAASWTSAKGLSPLIPFCLLDI